MLLPEDSATATLPSLNVATAVKAPEPTEMFRVGLSELALHILSVPSAPTLAKPSPLKAARPLTAPVCPVSVLKRDSVVGDQILMLLSLDPLAKFPLVKEINEVIELACAEERVTIKNYQSKLYSF